MAITLRNTKGSALTYEELDGNFTDLNGRVLDSDGIRALVDSDYVQLRSGAHYTGFDSDFGTKSTTNLSEGTNLYYTTARHDSDFAVSLAAASTDSVSEGTSNLYYTDARFDSAFGTKSTTNLTEGTNLYYTTSRFDSDFGTKSTSDLTEGTNLYYTTARNDSDTLALVDSAYVQARMSAHYAGFDSDFGTKTTTDLAEGTNLYYTTARHDSDFTTSLAAASLAYATDSATLWNGTPPTTVDSALDRIALLVRTLNGGTGA